MEITIDEKGYVTGWNLVGGGDGISCQAPADFDHFMAFYRGYRYAEGKLTQDPEAVAALQLLFRQEEIRRQREDQCFPYINRGNLWYQRLSQEQLEQLEAWYGAWLDAPQTLEMPGRLSWLDEEIQEV